MTSGPRSPTKIENSGPRSSLNCIGQSLPGRNKGCERGNEPSVNQAAAGSPVQLEVSTVGAGNRSAVQGQGLVGGFGGGKLDKAVAGVAEVRQSVINSNSAETPIEGPDVECSQNAISSQNAEGRRRRESVQGKDVETVTAVEQNEKHCMMKPWKLSLKVTGKETSLPSAAVADDLHVHNVASLILVKALNELLVHPRVKLSHPIVNAVSTSSSRVKEQRTCQRVRADSLAWF